jgi:hypothetical protein
MVAVVMHVSSAGWKAKGGEGEMAACARERVWQKQEHKQVVWGGEEESERGKVQTLICVMLSLFVLSL